MRVMSDRPRPRRIGDGNTGPNRRGVAGPVPRRRSTRPPGGCDARFRPSSGSVGCATRACRCRSRSTSHRVPRPRRGTRHFAPRRAAVARRQRQKAEALLGRQRRVRRFHGGQRRSQRRRKLAIRERAKVLPDGRHRGQCTANRLAGPVVIHVSVGLAPGQRSADALAQLSGSRGLRHPDWAKNVEEILATDAVYRNVSNDGKGVFG